MDEVKLQPWGKGFQFERLVNGGRAAKHVFIAGVEAARDGKALPALGKKRMGRFFESTL